MLSGLYVRFTCLWPLKHWDHLLLLSPCVTHHRTVVLQVFVSCRLPEESPNSDVKKQHQGRLE